MKLYILHNCIVTVFFLNCTKIFLPMQELYLECQKIHLNLVGEKKTALIPCLCEWELNKLWFTSLLTWSSGNLEISVPCLKTAYVHSIMNARNLETHCLHSKYSGVLATTFCKCWRHLDISVLVLYLSQRDIIYHLHLLEINCSGNRYVLYYNVIHHTKMCVGGRRILGCLRQR